MKNYTSDQDRRAKEKERLKHWARVELKAPDDGFIIEQNVALHETIVDNTTNLFQIAKVDPLIVLAAVPEDDLPALQDLKSQTQNHVHWTVRTVGIQPIEGFIDDIGYLIDPNQHTAVVRGHIPNPDGLLRAGSSSPPRWSCCRPRTSWRCRSAPWWKTARTRSSSCRPIRKAVYTMRRVQVTNRFEHTAYVRGVPAEQR